MDFKGRRSGINYEMTGLRHGFSRVSEPDGFFDCGFTDKHGKKVGKHVIRENPRVIYERDYTNGGEIQAVASPEEYWEQKAHDIIFSEEKVEAIEKMLKYISLNI